MSRLATVDRRCDPASRIRTAARSRPGGPFLTGEWRDLVMLNFEVDPALLAGRVPTGTELDTWRGRTLISIVGFRFLHPRLHGMPLPFHRHFDEVNLRFYVRREIGGEVHRGVVFIRELAPPRLIVWTARLLYGEHFETARVRRELRLPTPESRGRGVATYAWRARGLWNRATVEVAGEPDLPAPESEEAFVVERTRAFTRRRDGSTREYRVTHPPWRIWRATSAELDCDVVGELYGPEFARALSRPPTSALLADGSAVAVHRDHGRV